jgi:putative addiction module component (TIGR02574 family)
MLKNKVAMNTTLLSDVLKLSVSQRMQLVEAIWDSIVSFPESLDLTEVQRIELENRLQSYYSDREAGIPWEELRAKLSAL